MSLLLVSAGAGVVAAFAFRHRAQLVDDFMRDPSSVSVQEVTDADHFVAATAAIDLITFVAAFVALVVCVHRLYKNLPALGAASLRYTSGWAAGAWFVPFLNFVRPKQVVNDIWRASDPLAPAWQGSTWQGRPVSGLLDVWWTLLIGVGLYSRVAVSSTNNATLADLASADRQAALATAAFSVVLVITLAVVHSLVARQDERATRLGLT